MANAIKYSTTGDTQSLKKGNFYFGIGDVGKGPTSNTSYYNGVSPTTGGYTVYSYSSGQTSKISYYSASNDDQLITFTNGLSGQNFTTAAQCLNWYASQTDYVCVNRDYENIVTSGLTFNLDAGFTPSYPTTGTTWYDVSYSGNNGTLINSPIYNSTDGGSILFDGVDDYVSLGETLNLNTSSAFTISCVFKVVSYNNTYPTIFTLKTSIGNSLVLLLNSSGVYSPLTFGWNGSNTYKPTTSISTGVWNVLTLVYNGSGVSSSSNFNLYINNALLALSASSSLTGIGQVNSLGTLNTGVTSYWFNGNIPCIQIYNRSLSPSEVLQNYTAISSRFSSMDPDAQAFISAANITGSTQQGAINTLVVSLKGYGIWTKMKALYPFVGGTATQHKFNLKNPLDTDDAFRLVFNGGWTHSSTGALPNGTNAYAENYLNDRTILGDASNSLGFYSRTNNNLPNCNDVGVFDGTNFTGLRFNNNGQQSFAHNGQDGQGGAVVLFSSLLSSAAFLTQTRTSLNSLKFIRNGEVIASTTSTKVGINANQTYYIGATHHPTGPFQYSNREFALSYISDGLTDNESLNFYTAVQTFQTTLGRQVGVPIVSDSDAQAFLNAAVIENVTQANAVNSLVISLKSYGIWTKMKALYPFVGGTATQHKFNLKNPLDTDAAFRLVFNGGWTHSSTGALPNGTNAYANSFLIPSTTLTNNNYHLSHYSITQITSTSSIDIGCSESDGRMIGLSQYYNLSSLKKVFLAGDYVSTFLSVNNTDTLGLQIGTRTSNVLSKMFMDGVQAGTTLTVTNTNSLPIKNIYISANNSGGLGTPNDYSPRQCAFSSIGDGLTDTEASNYYTAVQTFQSTLGRNVGAPIVSDSDAQAFLDAAVITGITEANAVNSLVISLKGYGIWTKMKALYPFVGGTATTHKFNLKNPLDTDAAFRLVFNGGWTHSSTGALPNGTNAWGNTFFYTTNWTTKNNSHLSYYSRTNIAGASSEIGLFNSAPDSSGHNTYLSTRSNGDLFYSSLAISYNSGGLSVANTDGRGHFMANRNTANSQKGFKNGVNVSQNTTAAYDGGGTQPYALAAYNDGGSINTFSVKECAFASFGDGLTDTESSNFYTAVQAFQTSLSRNV